jgi:hypothetical protein
MGWPHPPLPFRLVSYHDVMTNKEIKKIQLGGWSGRKFKEVRRKIERMIKEEWGL